MESKTKLEQLKEAIFNESEKYFKIIKNILKEYGYYLPSANFGEMDLSTEIVNILYGMDNKTNSVWIVARNDFVQRCRDEKLIFTSIINDSKHYRAPNGFCRYFSFMTSNSTILIFGYDKDSDEIKGLYYKNLNVKLPQSCKSRVADYFAAIVCATDAYNRNIKDPDEPVDIKEVINESLIKVLDYIKDFKPEEKK